MLKNQTTTCPISGEKVNENSVRTVAIQVVILTLLSIVFNNFIISLLLTLDFSLRAFNTGKFSVLKTISKQVVNSINIKVKPIDAAPKKFAAALGFFFSLAITIFQISNLFFAAKLFGFVLISCALLEGVAGICLGCIVYSYVVLPFRKITKTE